MDLEVSGRTDTLRLPRIPWTLARSFFFCRLGCWKTWIEWIYNECWYDNVKKKSEWFWRIWRSVDITRDQKTGFFDVWKFVKFSDRRVYGIWMAAGCPMMASFGVKCRVFLGRVSPETSETARFQFGNTNAWYINICLISFPQQRKLMGSSAQISSGVCRCGSQEQVPERGSGSSGGFQGVLALV